MRATINNSPVRVRIPKEIKRRFDEYCGRKGLRKSYSWSSDWPQPQA